MPIQHSREEAHFGDQPDTAVTYEGEALDAVLARLFEAADRITNPLTFRMYAYIIRPLFSVSAVLEKEMTGSLGLDAVVSEGAVGSFSINAIQRANPASTFGINAVLIVG